MNNLLTKLSLFALLATLIISFPLTAGIKGDFYILPINVLDSTVKQDLKDASKTLFYLDDGTELTFIKGQKRSALKSTLDKKEVKAEKIAEKANFRMVVDELESPIKEKENKHNLNLNQFNIQLTVSLAFFLRHQLGKDLNRQEFERSASPLTSDLQYLNPLLYQQMTGSGGIDIRRVLFHWEIEHNGQWEKIYLPDGGRQVSREVMLSDGRS